MNVHPIVLWIYFYFNTALVTQSLSITESLNDSTNGTDTIVRNKRILGEIASAIGVGTFAYDLIRQSGGEVTDERKRCVTTVSAEPWESTNVQGKTECWGYGQTRWCHAPPLRDGWAYKIQMCTRNYNGEWHRNTMETWQPAGAAADFFRTEDTLHIKQGTLKWLWFEYSSTHCIKYLAVSCGHHVLDEWKQLNFVIGASQLESLYRTRTGLGDYIRRCGPDSAGVRLSPFLGVGIPISLTVPRAALLCSDKDENCIKQHIVLEHNWNNCYE